MAEGFHLTGSFPDQPPSPDHPTLECDGIGHLRSVGKEISSNHADQNRDGREDGDIYPARYARESGEERIKEQTPNTESEPKSSGGKHLRVHGLPVSGLIIIL